MSHWIAYEHDDTGWPTNACLIVTADSQAEARRVMADAITERRRHEDSPTLLIRISEIFIEAPRELAPDDERAAAGGSGPVFDGFDVPTPLMVGGNEASTGAGPILTR